jgi:hypothetical protein
MVLHDETLAAGEFVLLRRQNSDSIEVFGENLRIETKRLFECANVALGGASRIRRALFNRFDRLVVVVVFARGVVVGGHTISFNLSNEARVVSNNFS